MIALELLTQTAGGNELGQMIHIMRLICIMTSAFHKVV